MAKAKAKRATPRRRPIKADESQERDRAIIDRLVKAGIPKEAIDKALKAGASLASIEEAMPESRPPTAPREESLYDKLGISSEDRRAGEQRASVQACTTLRETAARWRKEFGNDSKLAEWLAQQWEMCYRAAIDPADSSNRPPKHKVESLDDAIDAFAALGVWHGQNLTGGKVTSAKTSNEQCVYLGGRRIRCNKKTIALGDAQADVVEALVELEAATEEQLARCSGRSFPGRILRSILKQHPALAAEITLPGKRGRGGYATTIVRDARHKAPE